MEVSQSTGLVLIEQVAALTGLPAEWVRQEMVKLVDQSGRSLDSLTLDDLRGVILSFLNSTALEKTEVGGDKDCHLALSH